MKKKLAAIACAISVVMLTGVFFSQLNISGSAVETAKNGTLDVTGTGSIKAKPDIAVLNIGVTTKGATTAVQDENTKTMNSVIAVIKANGVAEKDIKTVSYYINPDYNYDYTSGKEQRTLLGYTAYNMIEVKVRNIDKAGEVLAAATKAGANVSNGITFTLSNTEEYYKQALTQAYANAKGKADTLAKAVGVTIGLPVKVVENNTYYSPYLTGNYNSAAMETADAGAAVPVEKGEIEVTASVSVSYGY